MDENTFLKRKTLFLQVFNNDPGLKVLHYIMDSLCGYHSPNIVNNTESKELLQDCMLFNEAKRDVWLRLRPLLSKEILKKVEIDMVKSVQFESTRQDSDHPFLKRKKSESNQ